MRAILDFSRQECNNALTQKRYGIEASLPAKPPVLEAFYNPDKGQANRTHQRRVEQLEQTLAASQKKLAQLQKKLDAQERKLQQSADRIAAAERENEKYRQTIAEYKHIYEQMCELKNAQIATLEKKTEYLQNQHTSAENTTQNKTPSTKASARTS